MDRDIHAPLGPSLSTPGENRGQGVVAAALIGTATLAMLAVFAMSPRIFEYADRNGFAQDHAAVPSQSSSDDPLVKLKLFQGWNRPEVVILLSGEQHGYLQPCGCTSPQYGGLARRYNLLQAIRKRGWPVVSADLGNINQKSGPQAILKYTYAMKALDLMGYSAVNFGEYEMSMPLGEALANYALNKDTPRVVSANLQGHEKPGQPYHGMVYDSQLAKSAGPQVGIFGLTGLSVEQKVKDPAVKFSQNTRKILEDCLTDLKKKGAELFVLLYQGSPAEATACAKFVIDQHQKNAKYPLLDVILCVSDPQNSEPPAQPIVVGDTMIVEVGHKGRYVGVVGAFSQNGKAPFQLKYQLVCIDPALDTPKGQEKDQKVMSLMEEYTRELQQNNHLAKFQQVAHPVQVTFPDATYVGSDACKTCHAAAFKIWEGPAQGPKHSKAYQTLVDAKNPSLRQFDGECIVCHTVGFEYKTGFRNENVTKFLTDVGCESCHGPASEHVDKPRDPKKQEAINPFKWRGKAPPTPVQENARMLRIDSALCQKCHDTDNDNNFNFIVKWPKIAHMNTAQNAAVPPAPQIQAPPKK